MACRVIGRHRYLYCDRKVISNIRIWACILGVDRYSSPADLVLCTAGERDDISNLILGTGRMYAAFVADESKMNEVRGRVDDALVVATSRGFFRSAALGDRPVVIGPSRLPANVPESNVSTDDHQGDGSVPEEALAAVSRMACEFDFEIKVKPPNLTFRMSQ